MSLSRCLLGLAGVLLAAGAEARVREHFERTVAFNPGGVFSIENQNGSIEIEVGSDQNVRISGVSPRGRRGELDVETMNGSIEVDFPMNLTRTSRRHLRGSFGSGSGSFAVSTVNGSVSILPN